VDSVALVARKQDVILRREIEDALLLADGRRLRQMLLNLLSNAIKFTPRGGEVSICAAPCADGFEISVRDTGIGMEAEHIPKALERFGQVDSSLSRRYEGTGLGLPLTKALAELHGATLSIVSTPGTGTAVTVRFPADAVLPGRVEQAEAS